MQTISNVSIQSVLNCILENCGPQQKYTMGLIFRSASEGYWVAFLLPIAIYLSDLKFKDQSQTVVIIIAFHALLLSILNWMECNLSMLLRRMRMVNLVLTGVTLLICLAQGGDMYKVASWIALNFAFPYMFYNFVKQHPKSFTFGEAMMVSSAFVYNFWTVSKSLPFPPIPIQDQDEAILVAIFLQVLFCVTILGARIILLMQKPWKLYILEELYCLWAKYCIIAFVSRIPIQDEEVEWFLAMWPYKFLFATNQRFYLIGFWMLVSAVTGLYVVVKNYNATSATTVDRKAFHFFIVLVFFPGICKDHTLLLFCSAVVFNVFLLIETVRVLDFEIFGIKIGHTINQSVQGFRDHQDEGRLILTPIYLLVGMSLPIWLTGLFHERRNSLEPIEYAACLSGVVSIGIGDTFASIGGTIYGRTQWKDSRKTIEGTVCSILAQSIFVILIFMFDLVPYDAVSVTGLAVAIICNAVIEGNTDQIDNLVLPLITFIVVHLFGKIVNSTSIFKHVI